MGVSFIQDELAGSEPPSTNELLIGVVSYYKLDSDAIDETGYNDGSVSGAVSSSSYGFLNEGYDFDANGDYITVTNNWISTGSDVDLSVSFWMNPTDVTGGATGRPVVYQIGSRANGDWVVYYIDSVLYFRRYTGSSDNSEGWSSSSAPVSSTWQHWVIVYNSTTSTVDFYKDGVLNSDTTPAAAGFDIGLRRGFSSTPNAAWYYDGYLDEVGIWDRALTSDDVDALYNSGSGLSFDDFDNGDASILFTDSFNATGTTGTETYSSADLGTADSGRYVAVYISYRGPTGFISGVTINGVTATNASQQLGIGSFNFRTEVWYANVPTGTTGDIVVTYASAPTYAVVSVYSMYGINGTVDNTFTGSTFDVGGSNWSLNGTSGGFFIIGVHSNPTNPSGTAVTFTGDGVEDLDVETVGTADTVGVAHGTVIGANSSGSISVSGASPSLTYAHGVSFS